ncbi:hypothetical protein [Lutibacter agarilyticus]|nr:hypothetical protein [Lutibacter agarilyticus]
MLSFIAAPIRNLFLKFSFSEVVSLIAYFSFFSVLQLIQSVIKINSEKVLAVCTMLLVYGGYLL